MSAVLMNYPGRVIVGGDMNTNEEDELDLLRSHSAEVSCPELTYPSDVPQLRIDRLFVKGFEIVQSSVRATTVSDHRPLYAVVR
jgi:endonuclease/exonuclease/phosphatase family metal-dependent hydrolase